MLSHYGRYHRDLITRRADASYEIDAACLSSNGDRTRLLIEAKAQPREVARWAAAMDGGASPVHLVEIGFKEVEYALELRPEVLWLVGPGSVDPATACLESHRQRHRGDLRLPPPRSACAVSGPGRGQPNGAPQAYFDTPQRLPRGSRCGIRFRYDGRREHPRAPGACRKPLLLRRTPTPSATRTGGRAGWIPAAAPWVQPRPTVAEIG